MVAPGSETKRLILKSSIWSGVISVENLTDFLSPKVGMSTSSSLASPLSRLLVFNNDLRGVDRRLSTGVAMHSSNSPVVGMGVTLPELTSFPVGRSIPIETSSPYCEKSHSSDPDLEPPYASLCGVVKCHLHMLLTSHHPKGKITFNQVLYTKKKDAMI